jgi:hypothetical protein
MAPVFDTAGDCDIYRQATTNGCDTGKYDQEIRGSGFSRDELKLFLRDL